MRKHFAQYGNTILKREWCPRCKQHALAVDGVLQCCDHKLGPGEASGVKVMCEAERRRRTPLEAERREILERQGHYCFYCGLPFGALVYREGHGVITKIHWDHYVPYSYSLDNHGCNFVASCQICNLIKSSKVFETPEEARLYVNYQRAKKGYRDEEARELFGGLRYGKDGSRVF